MAFQVGTVLVKTAGYAGVAVEVGGGFGVVGDHGVKVEGLRVGEVGVGNGNGDAGPVGGEPTTKVAGIVAGAEVVVAGFGVALLAFEFVIVAGGAVVSEGVLAAVRIKVGVVADRASARGDDAGSAKEVFGIELDISAPSVFGARYLTARLVAEAMPVSPVANSLANVHNFVPTTKPYEVR
jgi:hypothetical protein